MANSHIHVLIAHERRFVAFSIASLLENEEFDVVANVTARSELESLRVSVEPSICIIGGYGAAFPQMCHVLRDRFPSSRIVLLDAEEPEDMMRLAQSQRLDGCLSLDLTPDLIISGLKLVAAGTRCFPRLDHLAANDSSFHLGETERAVDLTPRERAVLTRIGQGKANKIIARELDITESTVKAHLNAVLRKTGTHNRTQAARWAFDHGEVA